MSAGWPPTLRPNQLTSGCDSQYAENWLLPPTSTTAIVIITQPVSSYSSHRTRRVEGCRPRHCTAVKVHSPCPRLYITAAVAINTTVHHIAVRRANHLAAETCNARSHSVHPHSISADINNSVFYFLYQLTTWHSPSAGQQSIDVFYLPGPQQRHAEGEWDRQMHGHLTIIQILATYYAPSINKWVTTKLIRWATNI